MKFSEKAIRNSRELIENIVEKYSGEVGHKWRLKIELGNEEWYFDSEDEFFQSYSRCDGAFYVYEIIDLPDRGLDLAQLIFHFLGNTTLVTIEFRQNDSDQSERSSIQKIIDVLSDHEKECRLPESFEPEQNIFIGHGHSLAWRDLKDHLTDKHGYRVHAYETGARAGHAVRDILQSMLKESSFALLVLTKEDETKEGNMRARQNVIHETGLFQGKLGFNKAIALIEEGTESFSNIAGIEQIRFRSIQETFGEVIATINREQI